MKFVLLVEGHTEKLAIAGFLKRWLDPRLNQRVGIQPVRLEGWADVVGNVTKRAHAHLEGPKADDIIAVVALLDLYGPDFYPERLTSAGDRYDWGVQHLESEVRHPKFRAFFAVHEVEAWILSQPQLLPSAVQPALPSRARQPETVNFNEPPSKLLIRLYKERVRRTYKKTTYGKQLFDQLDPVAAAAACPYLAQLLTALLELAKSAGL